MRQCLNVASALGGAAALAACTTMAPPRNAPGSLYAPQQESRIESAERAPTCHAATMPDGLAALTQVPALSFANGADVLGPGDRVQLGVAGDTARLTGTYIITGDGAIELPGAIRLQAAGLTPDALESAARHVLIANGIVRGITGGVRLQRIELSGIDVAVSGAVFFPGAVRVGDRAAEVRNLTVTYPTAGDVNITRTLSTALRAAGGIRPDAAAGEIVLIRGSQWARIDMSGALDGANSTDIRLVAGDRVIVPSLGCLQENLIRPTSITVSGVRVFMSNLSRPAASNASSSINRESTSLPYGTRFLEALVSSNCVGGSMMNAGRHAVLIQRNPITGQTVVLSRSVEQLVRGADRDQYNPYMMPGDAMACYDSAAMNLRDVISTVSEAVTPYVLFRNVGN